MFIIICNSGLYQIQFDIYMKAILKLYGGMTGPVGSEGKHVQYVSGGGGANCVLHLGADILFCDCDFKKNINKLYYL